MMTMKYNVEKAEFRLETFESILKAMDGYHKLPWRRDPYAEDGSRIYGTEPEVVLPWHLPEMPDVSIDVWRYHVGFAIDRGLVECWKPTQYVPRHPLYYETTQFEWDMEVAEAQMNYLPPYRGTDVQVSSEMAPARLTYAGKAFIDNLNNPPIKEKAAEALLKWGLPAMMQVVINGVGSLLGASSQTVATGQAQAT